jgi:hypothetical protein
MERRGIPGAVIAFKVLCWYVAVFQFSLIALAIWVMNYVPKVDDPPEVANFPMLGKLLLLMALVFLGLNVYLALVKPKAWVWVVGVMQIIGAVIFCPLAFALLIPWYREEVKRYYDPDYNVLN